MSYIRWSTVINSAISFEDEIQLYKDGKSYDEVKEIKLKNKDSYTSNWYIYWSCNANSSDKESNKKEDQLLAICYIGGNSTILDYETVKSMYEQDDWTILGKFKQKELLLKYVKSWLDDVENDCID